MKDDQKAYEMFSRALKIEPSLAQNPVCFKIVNCLTGMHRTEEAIALLNDYIKTHPNSGEALLLKANLLSGLSIYTPNHRKIQRGSHGLRPVDEAERPKLQY